MVCRGCLAVSADTAVHLGSVAFRHSPSHPGERQRTLHLFPGISDHPHPGLSKAAANITMEEAASALLLVLLSQAEGQLPSGKRLSFNKPGTTSPNPRCASHA